MTEEHNALTDLFTACWKDDALKARFMSDPKALLTERGMSVPDDVEVKVVENTENRVYIILPMAPKGHGGLSDAELSDAAGGGCVVVYPGKNHVSN